MTGKAVVAVRTGDSSEAPLNRRRQQALKKWEARERLLRTISLVIGNASLLGIYVLFRNSKLHPHLGFQKLWPEIFVFIAHVIISVMFRSRRPFGHLGWAVKAITELVTVVLTGLLSSAVTRSRPNSSPGFSYYIFNCTTSPFDVLPPAMELDFTGCNQPMLVPPSSIETMSTNLLDWQIVIATALLSVYSLSMATLLRPGLSFALTLLSLHVSFYFLFSLYADSEFPCFAVVALSIYSILVIVTKASIGHFAHNAPDTRTPTHTAGIGIRVAQHEHEH